MLDLRRYFVKEQVGFFKRRGAFDILDPDTQQRVGVAKDTTGTLAAAIGSALGKGRGSARFTISEGDTGPAVAEIRRSWSFMMPAKIQVFQGGKLVGSFKKKMISIGGSLHVFDGGGKKLGE